jgi:anti-sigma factor RsiW
MIGLFRRRGEMSCQELVELVSDYLDGDLGRSDRARFEAHIRGCEHCTAYLEQMRLTIMASGRLTEASLDPAARDALLDAFRSWKRDREAPA